MGATDDRHSSVNLAKNQGTECDKTLKFTFLS